MAAPRQGSTLPDLRARIDAIDSALAALLLQRLLTARAVGEIKKRTGTPVLDAGREAEVRASLRAALQGRQSLADQLADLLLSAGRAEQGDDSPRQACLTPPLT